MNDESKHNLQLAEHGHQEVPNACMGAAREGMRAMYYLSTLVATVQGTCSTSYSLATNEFSLSSPAGWGS